MKKEDRLTAKQVRELLHYDPDTGNFTWRWRKTGKQSFNTRYAGKRTGYKTTMGGVSYYTITVNAWSFLAHRLAWLYMTGEWPAASIDHVDMDGTNNKWSNLREASKVQNAGNTRICNRNKTGFKGVSVCVKSGRYRANIKIDGQQTNLGHYKTAEEASEAYKSAARKKYGEFARFE